MRRETRVTIYERVKPGNKWGRKKVELPLLKRDGTLYLKDDRRGIFQLSWYESYRKKWLNVNSPVSDRDLPFLSDAIAQATDKSWSLDNRHRQELDQTRKPSTRKAIAEEVTVYLDAKCGARKTISAYTQALNEFQIWAAKAKRGRGLVHVDEITKSHLRRYFNFLVDGDEDDDGPSNDPFTAGMKIMRVNSFIRTALNLDPGKGPVTKKDFKRELHSRKVPEIYTMQEINAMFTVMNEDEHLLFSTLYESGMRKKELMYLEDEDLSYDEFVPGRYKTELRVQPKPQWGFQTKTGSSRNIWVPKTLMERLLRRKATNRSSKLLFGSSVGGPNYHFWDMQKAIAKRAGLDPSTTWLHKWRATAATHWLRSKELGGRGWDIGFVRQQLGHEDLASAGESPDPLELRHLAQKLTGLERSRSPSAYQ
jgi:integrase